MTVRRLAAVDARTYWLSRSIPDDQFLLYAFDGTAGDLDEALATVADRARTCGEFGLRIADAGFWTYPEWAPRRVGADQFVVHAAGETAWDDCLSAVAAWGQRQLDARAMTWRLHVFPAVVDVPGATGAAAVVVLQICHALADGVRASALAAYLLGRDDPVAQVPRIRWPAAAFPVRAVRAGVAHRRLVRDTDAGHVPAQAVARPLLYSNNRPEGARHFRTVVVDRGVFDGHTVTAGALSAISGALAAHLRALGDDPAHLGAEVPMATAGPRQANNHFGNVGIGLHPDAEPAHRARLIADEFAHRRRRAAHPSMRAEEAASAAAPAPLLRWGISHFDSDVRSPTVNGNTVVSSVNRGAADLRFGDARVLLSAGFATLSPMMGVTHGVHGIGERVAVSVHAAESAIGDIDSYLDRLQAALRRPQ